MKVVIVDDHPLVIKGLIEVISNEEGFEVIGQANNQEDAVKVITEQQPDLIIVDLRLGKESGFDIIEKLKTLKFECKFIILTSSSSLKDFKRANVLSVDGYISKEALPEEFISGIKMVARGRKYFDPDLVESYMIKGQQNNPFEELTSREQEVLDCLGKGMNNREISKTLYITEHTVKKHVSQILEKLNLSDRTQAALFAAQQCAAAMY